MTLLAIFSVLLLNPLTTLAAPEAVEEFHRPTVYLIRHAEKPPLGRILNPAEALSYDGVKRSRCIRELFGPRSEYNLTSVMAQKPRKNGSRGRPYETVKDLAQELGFPVDVSCERDDPKCVANTIRNHKGKGNILVCWEHKKLRDLVKALGGKNVPKYPKLAYNLIWSVPFPYSSVKDVKSMDCPGLDFHAVATRGDVYAHRLEADLEDEAEAGMEEVLGFDNGFFRGDTDEDEEEDDGYMRPCESCRRPARAHH